MLFLTQEKVIKKINQDRDRGDLKRAYQRALDAHGKWPEDYAIACEAIKACFDLPDYHQAVTLLKATIRKNPKNRNQILDRAYEAFKNSFNPFLGSFIVETLIRVRNIEGTRDILRSSPQSFIHDLIKRAETRSRGFEESKNADSPVYIDNELLLGLLYREDKKPEKAVESFGRALEHSHDDAQLIGSIFVELERELPHDAKTKFYFGLASELLSHPDKAENRFFQCMELEDPPLEKLLNYVEMRKEHSRNHALLKGEILIRSGRHSEGVELMEEYLAQETFDWEKESANDNINQLFPGKTGKTELAMQRLSLLSEESLHHPDVVFLYCDLCLKLERVKTAVEVLEAQFEFNRENLPRIISWIRENEDVSQTAPAQKLLAFLHLENGDYAKAAEAVRLATEIDRSLIPAMNQAIDNHITETGNDSLELQKIKVELHARGGDPERAEEILRTLGDGNTIEDEELFRLTREIMNHCGINIDGIVSSLEISLRNKDVSGSLPFVTEFLRDNPDQHPEFAKRVRDLAEDNDDFWQPLAELMDSLATEESRSKSLKILHAYSHLQNGEVEKAVFEYDQLLMADDEIRYDLINIYEKAAERFSDNTTLQLALYHLYLDEEQYAMAARYLCRSLVLDPGQIRDVLERFDRLVEKEPENVGIWEEMLRASLSMNHLNLARKVLKRSVSMLKRDDAAALHIYGARISLADGKVEDALRCLALTMTSPRADLKSVETELNTIIGNEQANAEARYIMSDVHIRLGNEKDAVQIMKRCLELSPAYSEKIRARLEKLLPESINPWLISRVLGEIAISEERFEEACRLFKDAQKCPEDSLQELGAVLERLSGEYPENLEVTFLHTHNLILEKRYPEAVVILKSLIEENGELVTRVTSELFHIFDRQPDQYEANRLYGRILVESGEVEKSLEPVLRILALEGIDPGLLDEAAGEFLEFHERNGLFLVHYARIKALKGENGESLERYRQALDIDSSQWQQILTELNSREWPEKHDNASTLLKVDCLMTGEWTAEAFNLVEGLSPDDHSIADEVMARLYRLIEKEPAKEKFLFGIRVCVENGRIEESEKLAGLGYEALSAEEIVDLKIEFAEILEVSGRHLMAGRLFEDVLSDIDDREAVLKRIEEIFVARTESELMSGLEKIEKGQASDDESVRLVRLALDRNLPGKALLMLRRAGLSGRIRSVLIASAYLSMDRPLIALSVLESALKSDLPTDHASNEIWYLEGTASERLGDFGRAAAAFSRVLGTTAECDEIRERAEKNYTRFLETQFEESAKVLVKTGTLECDQEKREDLS